VRAARPANWPPPFTRFAADHSGSYAPLYAHLASRIAGDRELLAIAAHASPGQSQPDLLLAAVHYPLARQPGSPLAATTRP
jgi:hypothetical protein